MAEEKTEPKRCNAKTRRGDRGPCKNWAMPNGRCRMHGGKSTGAPKGSKNATTYGIYTVGIKEDEKPLWEDIKIGSLDDELRLLRLQLMRAVKAQKEFEEDDENSERGFENHELSSATETIKVGKKKVKETKKSSKVRKRPDFRRIIYELTGRIADLETKRALILEGGGDDIPKMEELGKDMAEALDGFDSAPGATQAGK